MAGYLDYEKIGQSVHSTFVRTDEITCVGYVGSDCKIKITLMICHANNTKVLIIEDQVENKGTKAINFAEKALAWFERVECIEHGTCVHVLRQNNPINSLFLLRYNKTYRGGGQR